MNVTRWSLLLVICFMLVSTTTFASPSHALPTALTATHVRYLPLVVKLGPRPAFTITLTPIGTPIWKPVDIHLFSASGGDFSDFEATIAALLPPPNHGAGGSPGQPHAPPYETELAQGISPLNLPEGRPFTVSEFSNGNAVYIVWMVVPNPGIIGSSPDFASGAIIPKSVLPIHFSGVTLRNGQIYDPVLTDQDASPDAIPNVEGASHFPVFIADNTSFGPPATDPVGNYDYQITMTDTQGNGWSLSAQFSIQSN